MAIVAPLSTLVHKFTDVFYVAYAAGSRVVCECDFIKKVFEVALAEFPLERLGNRFVVRLEAEDALFNSRSDCLSSLSSQSRSILRKEYTAVIAISESAYLSLTQDRLYFRMHQIVLNPSFQVIFFFSL